MKNPLLLLFCLLCFSCTLFVNNLNKDNLCDPESTITNCDNNVLTTCQDGFLFQEDCGISGCNQDLTGCNICGDGNLDAGEECDDSNNQNNDGCSADCQLEITEVEPNDTAGDANQFAAPFFAELNPENDIDFVSLTLNNNSSSVTLETSDRIGLGFCSNEIDTFLTFFDTDGSKTLAVNNDGGTGFCSRLVLADLPPGTYFASIENIGGGDATFQYQIHVTIVENICGNGIITGAEECDDGNLIDNDGCDDECQNEN